MLRNFHYNSVLLQSSWLRRDIIRRDVIAPAYWENDYKIAWAHFKCACWAAGGFDLADRWGRKKLIFLSILAKGIVVLTRYWRELRWAITTGKG